MTNDTAKPNEATEWDAERIAGWRRAAERHSGRNQSLCISIFPDEFLSLLDALEEAHNQAAIDRDQCDRVTREAAEMAEELRRTKETLEAVRRDRDFWHDVQGKAAERDLW